MLLIFANSVEAKSNKECSAFHKKNTSLTCGISGRDACIVGAVGPGGGYIFFVDQNNQFPCFDYLEAAPGNVGATQLSPGDRFSWCSTGSVGATASIYLSEDMTNPTSYWPKNALGQGKNNTLLMNNSCINGAAEAAANYISISRPLINDWYLPSMAELLLMVNTLRQYGVGSFVFSEYWSSTEINQFNADNRVFPDGQLACTTKDICFLPVHPIRSW